MGRICYGYFELFYDFRRCSAWDYRNSDVYYNNSNASIYVGFFLKAGLPGWVSLIPIVNNYYLFEIATGEGFSCFLLFLPIISWIVYVKMLYCLQEAFGASGSFYWGLLLLPGIFFPLLAFSRTYYDGPYRDFI